MVVELNTFISHNNIGRKAQSLIDLNRYGFKVPKSIALDTNEYLNIIDSISDQIFSLLSELKEDNINSVSSSIFSLFTNIKLESDLITQVMAFIDDQSSYVLRLSIDGVDEFYSFAGLFPTFRGMTRENIIQGIIDCYKTLYSYNSLAYILKHGIDWSSLKVAIIIQKELQTDKYLNVTTMNPLNLNSSDLIIDVISKDIKEQYIYDYRTQNYVKEDKYNLISQQDLLDVIKITNKLQIHFGYPLEIEFAIEHGEIYVLQTRAINNFLFENIAGHWDRADITCKPFLKSIICPIYNSVINEYATKSNVKGMEQPILDVFNQVYYNIFSFGQLVDSFVPYNSAYFKYLFNCDVKMDDSNAIIKNYYRFKNQRKHEQRITDILNDAKVFCKDYQQKYHSYCKEMSNIGATSIEKEWSNIINDYESLYAKTIAVRLTILLEKNIVYKKLKDYLSFSDFDLAINLEEKKCDIINQKKFYDVVQKIFKNEQAYHYWFSSATRTILNDYEKGSESYYHPDFRRYINTNGYLSYYGMDITEPFYVEDVEEVIREVKKLLANFKELDLNVEERTNVMNKLKSSLPEKKYGKILVKITRLQELIILETYLHDYINRFHFLIKRYSKMLAKFYLTKKVILQESDFWFLDIKSINDYVDGEIDNQKMQQIALNNKLYYGAYRHFSPSSFGGTYHSKKTKYDFKGVGCSTKVISGQIRMIKSLDELKGLKKNDILVTKTLNINLLFQLPKIQGIILSDMYLSSSMKNLIREFKIPCLLLENCSKKLKDKMYIEADCYLGTIRIKKQ